MKYWILLIFFPVLAFGQYDLSRSGATVDALLDKVAATSAPLVDVNDPEITGKVLKSGDTMTGLLQFSGTGHAGLKLHELTEAQRDALTPLNGMIIINTTAGEVQTYLTSQWISLGTPPDAATIKSLYESNLDTNNLSDALKAKLDYLTVTGAVDLDQFATDIGLNNAHRVNTSNPHSVTAAQTISGATIPAATVAGADKVIIQDADDSDNVKTVTAQSIADLGSGGSGDVSGPASATDEAIAVFDGPTGKLLKETPITIDGSGNMSGVGEINLTGNANINGLEFEGATADEFETTLGVIDPDADRTINFPNKSGTVALTNDLKDWIQIELSPSGEDIATGAKAARAIIPFTLTNISIVIDMDVAPVGSVATYDINEAGVSIFSTLPTIDDGETSTTTAATPYALNDTTLTEGNILTWDIDGIGSTTPGQWPLVLITGDRQ